MNNELKIVDHEIYEIVNLELKRQETSIELIASENFASNAVMQAQGSILTNKYAEGYAGKRYYSGCQEVDKAEILAIERAKQLFNCSYANLQPHSGCQANQTVYFALLNPMDTILGMSLNSGGHLTHGSAVSMSGKWLKSVTYDVNPDDYLINYDQIEELALQHRPKMIIAGFSCYSRQIDFARFRAIADKVSAYLLADIAHIAGLVATGLHPSPFPHCHIVTSTTHKTLRGPRGGMILSDDEELSKKIDKALFPGIQGGPLMHVIAAKAVALKEAMQPDFKDYISQVIKNAQTLATTLQSRGYNILTGGTENHIVVLDLRKILKQHTPSDVEITGKEVADSLERAGITANKNSIAFDTKSPFVTSGVRFGSPACTSRGFKEKEFEYVGNLIADIIDALKIGSEEQTEKLVKIKTQELLSNFPIYKSS